MKRSPKVRPSKIRRKPKRKWKTKKRKKSSQAPAAAAMTAAGRGGNRFGGQQKGAIDHGNSFPSITRALRGGVRLAAGASRFGGSTLCDVQRHRNLGQGSAC